MVRVHEWHDRTRFHRRDGIGDQRNRRRYSAQSQFGEEPFGRGVTLQVLRFDLVLGDVEVEEPHVGRVHANRPGIDPRLAQIRLVATHQHGGEDVLQQVRHPEATERGESGDHPVVAVGQIRQQGDAETRPARLLAVGAVERVDREVRQQPSIDERRGEAGGAGERHGPEDEGDGHRRADGVRHRLLIGVETVDPAIVPGQPHQLPPGHVGDGDDESVTLFRRQLVVIEGEIPEGGDTEVGQLAPDPVVRVVALVDPRPAEQCQRRADQRHPLQQTGVEEFAVIQLQRKLFDLRTRHRAGVRRGRDDGADDGSRRGAGDALRLVSGIQEADDGAHQTDALDTASREHQVGTFDVGHAGDGTGRARRGRTPRSARRR